VAANREASTAPQNEQILLRPRSPEGFRVAPPSQAPRNFHASMPGYAPTPLRDAPAAARRLGVAEVLVKDESARLGLPSFKVLGASWAVNRALAARLGTGGGSFPAFQDLRDAAAALRPLTLSAATDGNHGRAVARMARLLGFQARIYVPAGTAPVRIDAIRGEGASVAVIDGGYEQAVRRSAEDASRTCLVISDTSWDGYEQVPRWIVDGYQTIFAEIEEELAARDGARGAARPDVVAFPVGVGALAAATVQHFWSAPGPRPNLVSVEPVTAACVLGSVAAGQLSTLDRPQTSIMAGLNCATPSLVAWPLVSRGIDCYLAVSDQRVPPAMRVLAEDGIEAGETGAGGLAGMLRITSGQDSEHVLAALGWGPGTRVLLLCTEGPTDPDAYLRLTGGTAGYDDHSGMKPSG
jgi:diaminopropionate ammonia-lyase